MKKRTIKMTDFNEESYKKHQDWFIKVCVIVVALFCISWVMSSTTYCNYRMENTLKACNDYYQPLITQCKIQSFGMNMSGLNADGTG